MWLQACEVVSGLRAQDAIERTDHCRLRSAARRRWERVISAQSKGEQSPAAAKFRMGPCCRSKCSERKSVTPYDTDVAGVRAAWWHLASEAVDVLLPGPTQGITHFLRAVHCHNDRAAGGKKSQKPFAFCPLPVALCPLPFALCILLFALCPLPFGLCPLSFALRPFPFCPLPFALYPLPFAFCPLPFVLCPLPFVRCPLPFARCPLPLFPFPFALCPLPFALCPLPFALCPLPFALCPLLLCPLLFVLCPLPFALCPLPFVPRSLNVKPVASTDAAVRKVAAMFQSSGADAAAEMAAEAESAMAWRHSGQLGD